MVKSKQSSANFDVLFSELEKLVARMENADMPLEEAMASYQRGVELVRLCQDKLALAEQQLKVFDDGVLKPLKLSDV